MRGKRKEDCKGRLLKGNNPAGTDPLSQGAQGCNGIGEKLENVTAYGGVEPCIAGEMSDIGFDKFHIMQARLGRTGPCAIDRTAVPLDGNDFSRRTDELRSEHCYVADTRANIQEPLSRTDSSFAEEVFCNRCKAFGLPNQAVVLGVSTAKDVVDVTIVGHNDD